MPSTASVGGAGPSTASASASSGQGGSGGAGGGAGGGVTSAATSVASSSSSGCPSTDEICDNGVDDDCDGLTDCADPKCSGPADGRECVAPAPQGWTLIAFAPGATAMCPSGSSVIAVVAEAPTSASSTCDCTCDCSAPENNPCVHGMLAAKIGNANCTALNLTFPVTGGCDSLGVTINNTYGSLRAKPLGIAAIDAPGTGVLPGMQPGASATTCAPDVTAAAGCTGGGVCLPKATSASVCVQMDGDVPCPGAPFINRTVVGATAAVDDQRICAACTCSSSAASCANPMFSGFPNDMCGGNPVNAAVINNTCTFTPNNTDWDGDNHFVYTATPVTPTCSLKGALPAVSGTIKPQSATTICCPP